MSNVTGRANEETVGILRLHRFNGVESYSVSQANINIEFYEPLQKTGITFSVNDTSPIEVMDDTAELRPAPNAYASVFLTEFDVFQFVGQEYEFDAYDEEFGGYLTNIYYAQHDEIRDNRIAVLGRNGALTQFRWIGTMIDPNHYVPRVADSRMEVECWATMTRRTTFA